ncbi:MAG: ATP-binding protein [Chthoniobacterales bacterium]
MKLRTLRARVALLAVAVLSGALVLFGAGAAWNLRRELIANLDQGIQTDARDFLEELHEQPPNWNEQRRVAGSFAEDTGRFQFVEVRANSGRMLYRSSSLGDESVLRGTVGQNYSVTANGRRIRFGVFESQGVTFALGKDQHEVDEMLAGLISAYLVTLPLVVIAGGAGVWWIARRAAAPIQTIAENAARISASDLHQRIPEPESHDEMADLTTVLNDMFERLQRSFEQVTRFTSDASHELKTPLALMRAHLESALDASRDAPEQRELLSSLIGQCSQISQVVDGLLFLSRADDRQLALEYEPVDLVALVEDLREDAEILATAANLTLQLHLPPHLVVCGDERLIRRAVMNLIDNAIKYNRAGGRVAIAASVEGRNNLLTFGNTGPGIPLPSREKIFERFYRSDSARSSETSGHGLGLSITREIARAHRGEVRLARSDADWTEFWLFLPPAGGNLLSPYSQRGGSRA